MSRLMRRWTGLALCALYPFLTGFVLLKAKKATLAVSPENPIAVFVWNGQAPPIAAKDKFRGGQYKSLNDKDFMQALLVEALAVWNAVPGAYVQLVITEGAARLNPKDEQHSIVIESSDNLSTAAYASPQVPEERQNTIIDCDISVSDRRTSATELTYTLTHELGHCLGLGHAHTNYNAMMGYSRSSRSPKLGADDIAGLIYLYPDSNYVKGKPKELISCSTIAGGWASSLQLFFLCSLIMAPIIWVVVRASVFPDDNNDDSSGRLGKEV